jgi:type I restriction enzyme S subunit
MKHGWEIKKLSQLFDVKSSRRVHQSDWKTSGIPFYRAREVVKLSRDGLVENELFISQELYNEFTKEKGAPKEGDIIVSAVGTLGQCYLVKVSDNFYFKDASVLWFENLGNVNSRFIEYAFKADSIIDQVMDGSMGATVGTLTISRAKDIQIPIPPLPEQQRIVAILDDAFTKIEKAKANAEQNLKNAKELFDVYLHKYYTSKEDGWEEKKLKEVAEYFNGLTYSPKDVSNEGIIVLRSSNVQNDVLDFEDIVRVNITVKEKIIVKQGDILMCSRNGSARLVGKTATIKNLDEEMTFGTFMMIVRSEYNPYLSWFFKSTDFRNQIKGGANTMINQITRYMLDDIVLSFPPIEKQNEVVRQLDALSIEIKKLETIYNQKINDLEELKKSVLQKAFSGEL